MKRFTKIFAVVMAIAMLTSVFCFQSSAVIADSSLDISVKLEKVTTPGEVVCADTGLDATELGNIYKATLSFKAVNAGFSRFQAAVIYDDTLFDVCYGDGTENFIAYPVGDGSDFGWTAACTWKGLAGDADAYDTNGNGGQTSSLKIKCYGLKHPSAGTTYVAEKLDYSTEQYANLTAWAYPGEAVPANRGGFICSYTCSMANAKALAIAQGEQEVVSVYLSLKEGKTDADVNGTELRLSAIDYSGVALSNMTLFGSIYGMAKTAQQDSVVSCTKNGLAYTYSVPSPVKGLTSQIRYTSAANGDAKASFDIRTRATMSSADFLALVESETNAKALAEAGKLDVGFVYAAQSVVAAFDVNTAKSVATGGSAAGYYKKSVSYIQSTGDAYVWTCFLANSDYNDGVNALAYVTVDGTTYYCDTVTTTDFSDLYDTWSSKIPTA